MRTGSGRKKKSKKYVLCLLGSLVLLAGCGGTEPEKRAYPLAVSVDLEEGQYVVAYAMANLPLMTGQNKDQEEGGEEQNMGSVFRGNSFGEIRQKYEASQEYMLDLGHVKALILGETLLADPGRREELMEEIGKSMVLGKNLYLFRTASTEEVMEQNGKEKDSIGEFLAGFYENRTAEERRPVTLEDFFYTWANTEEIRELPELLCAEGQIYLTGLSE